MRGNNTKKRLSILVPGLFLIGMVGFSIIITTFPPLYNERQMQRHLAYLDERIVFTSYFYWYKSNNILGPSPHMIDLIPTERAQELYALTPADFPPDWEGPTDPNLIVTNDSGTYYVSALSHNPPADTPSYNSTGDVIEPVPSGVMENITTWIDWMNPDWHEWELRCMMRAGIDVLIPVFWGNGLDDGFSTQGLPPLVSARNDLVIKATNEMSLKDPGGNYTTENYGEEVVPKIAMFFDTTCMRILWADELSKDDASEYYQNFTKAYKEGPGPDLKDPYWQHEFWKCIERFYDRVNGSAVFEWNGYYICWLYEAHWFSDVGGLNGVFSYCKELFQEKYGKMLLFVGPHQWKKANIDVVCDWGACCDPEEPVFPPINHGISCGAVSPGYYNLGTLSIANQEPSYMYRTIDIYEESWQKLIDANTAWVHIETWNEWHEGTHISWTQEQNFTFIDATREMVDLLHANDGKVTETIEIVNLLEIILPLGAFGAVLGIGIIVHKKPRTKAVNAPR
ncbi:MAG: hypothetical protein ACFFCS_10970 [Candidatus Hodarchaeota archaeon]